LLQRAQAHVFEALHTLTGQIEGREKKLAQDFFTNAINVLSPDMEQLTFQATLPERVECLGWIKDENVVPSVIRSHAVAVLPSLEEGQALFVWEALASGLPCIVTKETGAIFTEGKEGFYVPARDSKKLAESIQYYYDNPSEVSKMGKAARVFAEEHPWERFRKELLEELENV
jgi:glycosyltransferase involved in cell wall biosynthesis